MGVSVISSTKFARGESQESYAIFCFCSFKTFCSYSSGNAAILSSFQKFSSFQMESMANVNYMSPSSGSTLQIFGDLGLVQREALGHRGTNTRYDVSILYWLSQINNMISPE